MRATPFLHFHRGPFPPIVARLLAARWAATLLIVMAAANFCACSLLMADRKAEEEHHRQMVKTMDTAHIFVTTGDLPKTKPKPYRVLGNLRYTEPFSPDTIDKDRIERKLKAMALATYPNEADAVIKVKSDVDFSGPKDTVVVSGEVIQFESSADRAMMHSMWENMVVSPK
jgi:hypothetical protein